MKQSLNLGIRRFFAFLIDWNLCGVPAILISFLITDTDTLLRPSVEKTGFILLFLVAFFSFPVLVLFRDAIFKGRSIGNRIFGLVIIDKKYLSKTSVGKTILRNLFSFQLVLLILINF